MTKQTNIIHINGKRYDAVSGQPLEGQAAPAKAVTPAKHGTHQPAAHLKHHKTESSHTLMRQSVKKPSHAAKPAAKRPRANAVLKAPAASVVPKLPIQLVDDERLRHAKHVPQSKLVSRFSASLLAPDTSSFQPTQPVPPVAHEAKTIAQPTASHRDHIEQALRHATSHQQPAVRAAKHRQPRLSRTIAGVSGGALAIVVLIGLATHQNSGTIRLQLAAGQAGFAASLPSHTVAGYSLGALNPTRASGG